MNVTANELAAAGFKDADNEGVFWHWTGSPGVQINDGKFIACDAFSNGDLQYVESRFDDFTTAANYAIQYFS